MQAMANMAILTKSCHSHNGDEFGKILSNCQIKENNLNTWRPAMLADLTILASLKKVGKNFVNLTNVCKLAKHTQASHENRLILKF